MTDERSGDWFQTYPSRTKFYILDPRPEDVNIRDIAHSLSLKCRYGGHCAYFYSVAEHCVLLSHLVPGRLALAALMHDSAETYTGDIMRPIKESIGDAGKWRQIEQRLDEVICLQLGLNLDELHDPLIKEYDSRILTDERDVLQAPPLPGKNYGDKLSATIRCLTWSDAEHEFLARYDELMRRRPVTTAAPELSEHDEQLEIPNFLRERPAT